ncbi:hypothetical protein ACJRPK_14060 [Aquimarina sp. 2-A2]|uniref:hypothetical protein n=1 Tax=Aquimarina sp. 2-A2 TaxID=3382644 RepID=UPI00387F054B
MGIDTSILDGLDLSASEEVVKRDFSEFHYANKIDPNKVYKKPPLAVSVGLDPVPYKGTNYPLKLFSFGDISMIVGEEKSRKSFVKSMITGCAIGGKANEYNEDIKGYGLHDKWIIDLDGEQSEYDCFLNHDRIPKMCGGMPQNYHYVQLRGMKKKERVQYLDWLFMESEFRNNLGLVNMDGFVDFCKNFNDLETSEEYVVDLLRYAAITKCHISGVLHLNPGSEKSRGHLGTILQQKAEQVIMVKNIGDVSEVVCKSVRGSRKFETFYVGVDSNWLPYKADYSESVGGI